MVILPGRLRKKIEIRKQERKTTTNICSSSLTAASGLPNNTEAKNTAHVGTEEL
ncbi:uncharacterized protein BT62DRAFT_925918 [Guyanagaster necrorhizus]|uniref:Uncharacterized protein n=1 Tax=Guyanagaster necrorhizus TaxID=856835 RepID=A0A9P7W1S0_9AGAR|nr:uncharacterized protein BT62DRAFT_925918 [Guyanagaster necrorhizus MCA 3950]KAG7451741.1 hypothetical protein BT62DRAFT_925918 [Guyanagaster necrorhizus MCA 3950]